MNATDIQQLRKAASSPFWWTRFWTFRRATLSLCHELEKARNAEPLPLPRDLLMEIETLKAEKTQARSGMMMLFQFIHTHNRLGRMKPQSQSKPLTLLILALLIPWIVGAQSGFYRNDWTTNPAPQVNRGFGITIQTNAGHKLVINVDGGALTNQLYWTNIAGLLRTIRSGFFTNFVVDTNIVAMTIGSIAFINPTNDVAAFGPDVLGNNSGTFATVSAFGNGAASFNSAALSSLVAIGNFAASSATTDIAGSVAIGNGAMADNTGVLLTDSVGIGQDAFALNSGTVDASLAIGASAGQNNSSNITDSVLFGEIAAQNNSGNINQSVIIGGTAAFQNSAELRRNVIIGRAAMSGNTAVKDTVIVIGDSLLASSAAAGTNWVMIGSLATAPAGGGVNLGSFGFNNTFANIGAVSNRWIFGWNATNTLANSMVFGNKVTNYNFRNLEYTFPADQGATGSNSFLGNNGAGILSWTNLLSALQIVSVNTNLTNGPLTMVVPAENGLEKFYITLTTSNNVNLLRFYSGFSEYNLQVGPASGTAAGFRINTKSPETVQFLSANNLGLLRFDADQMVIPGRMELGGTTLSAAANVDLVASVTNRLSIFGPAASSGLNTNGAVLHLQPINFPFTNIAAGAAGFYATNEAGTFKIYAFDSAGVPTKLTP